MLKDSETYKTLLFNQGADLLVYDNSPVPQSIPADYSGHIEYVHDPANGGISIAYNYAAKFAKDHGHKWLLLLDQDTLFPSGAMSSYIDALNNHTQISMFVPKVKNSDGRYISPTKYMLKTSRPVKKAREGVIPFSKACPINSGIMVSVDSFLEAGGYDEKVTLDFSDIRFIEKYKKTQEYFFCMNIICLQNYSINEKDENKLLSRYKVFLKCAKHCKRETLWDDCGYLFTTLKRTIRLTICTRNVVFLKTYYHNYLLS